jgi:AraC-like DNA-binding protein
MVSTYSTANIPSNQHARFVQSVADDCYGSFFHWEPLDNESFSLNMAVRHFGDIMIARHQSSGFSQVNRAQSARWLKRRFVVHTALNSGQIIVFDGKPLVLNGGDFTLLDTSRSCMREQVGPAETIAFAVPEEPLRRHVPNVDDLVGQVFSSKDSLCSAAVAILRSTSELDDVSASESVGKRMTRTLLDLLGILAESRVGPGKAGGKHRAVRAAAARRYVDDHLADADLSVASVAEALEVSTRYLHMIFAREDQSLLDYIRKARMAACSAQLLSPASRNRSISEIAYSWGFNDLSHFCRLFRTTFGMSARDYRKSMKPR